MPAGRKLQAGAYFASLASVPPAQTPTAQYDHDLLNIYLSTPGLGGVTAYHMQARDNPAAPVCSDGDALVDKFCTLQRVYGGDACVPGQARACGLGGTQACGADCAWGACTGQCACTPGQTRTAPCGNCGTRTDSCSSSCQWVTGPSCDSEGECEAGSTQTCCACGSKPCTHVGVQSCRSTCSWGACADYACGGQVPY